MLHVMLFLLKVFFKKKTIFNILQENNTNYNI